MRVQRRHRGWMWVALACAAGCGQRPEVTPDLLPPWVLGVEPAGNDVPVRSEIRVRFSEPLRRDRVFWFDAKTGRHEPDGVTLGLAADEFDLVAGAESPPFSAEERAFVVPADVALSEDRTSVLLVPRAPLEPEQEYVIVVSRRLEDDAGNRLILSRDEPTNETHVVLLFTGRPPDRTRPAARLVSPPAASVANPYDLRAIEIEFSEPVEPDTLTPASVSLVEWATQAPVAIRSLEPGTSSAKLVLAASEEAGCATLCPGRRYALAISSAVLDYAGNPFDGESLALQTFETARCLDQDPPNIEADSIDAAPTDVSVAVTWRTDEPGPSRLLLTAGDLGALAACAEGGGPGCRSVEGEPAPCDGEPDPCAPTSPPLCPRRVDVDGLAPATRYAYRVVSFDGGGRASTGPDRTFVTGPAVGRPVVSEVFVSPAAPLDGAAEFIELRNVGSGPIDLAGWRLARCPDAPCTGARDSDWVLRAFADGLSMLAPGAVAVAAGDAFPLASMGFPASALRLRGSSPALLTRGLRDGNADGYALVDPAGRVVSSYGGWFGPGGTSANRGRAFERIGPGDGRSSWTRASRSVPASAQNFATPGE